MPVLLTKRAALIRLASLVLTALLFVSTTPVQAAEAAPVDGGTLIFGRSGDSLGLDPAARSDGESLNVCDHIFDGLVRTHPGTTNIEPWLATKWEISPDALNYTFHLVPNAKFTDGTPVDADAVVFSFKRQMDVKHPAHAWSGPFEYFEALGLGRLLKDVVRVDPRTVRFELNKPYSPFLAVLSMQAFAVVSPQAVMSAKQDFALHPVGSGPYKLRVWEKKQKIVLTANPDFWGPKPHLQTIIFRVIPDNNTRLAEMLAGNLQAMDNPDTNSLKTLQEHMGAKVKLAQGPGLNIGYLAINMDHKPFDNGLVRQAVNYAINKPALIKNIYNGYAIPAKNPLPPTLWGYNDSVKDYGYDPAKAVALLKQAGFASGFSTTIWAMPVARPYMPDGRKVAEFIQGDLAKVGISAKIVTYDWGTYLTKMGNGEHDLALMGWTGDIGDPDNFLYILLDPDNAVKPAQNYSFYRSAALHKLLLQAQTEPAQDKRAKLYQKAQEIVHADAPLVNLVHSTDVVPLQAQVQGFVLDPTGRRRFAEAWLEAAAKSAK